MSVKVMTWVWEQDIQQGPKFLLLAIADHAGDEDWSAWPSIERLAKKVNASESTVRRQIAKLVNDGWLRVQRNAGPGADGRRPNLYTILQGGEHRQVMQGLQSDTPPPGDQGSQPDTPADEEGAQSDTPEVRSSDTSGVRSSDTQTISEPSGNRQDAAEGGSQPQDDAERIRHLAGYITRQVMEKHPFNNAQAIAGVARSGLKAGVDSHLLMKAIMAAAADDGPVTINSVKHHMRLLSGGYQRQQAPRTVDDPGTKVHSNGLEVLGGPVNAVPPNDAFLKARRQAKEVRHE